MKICMHGKINFFTHSAVSVKYDEPLSDDFAFVVVVAVQLHIAVVLPLEHNRFVFSRYKSMYDYR